MFKYQTLLNKRICSMSNSIRETLVNVFFDGVEAILYGTVNKLQTE